MSANGVSFEKTGVSRVYMLASRPEKKRDLREENAFAFPHSSLTHLHHARFSTEEATTSYFKRGVSLIGQTVSELKGENVISWNQVIDAKLILMSKKAVQIALKKILKKMEWERLYEDLQECRKKLKKKFQQFYLKIKEEQEGLEQFRVKNRKEFS